MDDLENYLVEIVEPTIADFQRNPNSARHAYLACVATYHATDRVEKIKKNKNLIRDWRSNSVEFLIADMVCHHFKHVKSNVEKNSHNENGIRIDDLVFNRDSENLGINDIRNLQYVIIGAINFLRKEGKV